MDGTALLERTEAPPQPLQPKRLEGLMDFATQSSTWGSLKPEGHEKPVYATNVHAKATDGGSFLWGGPDGTGADTDVSFAVYSIPFQEIVRDIKPKGLQKIWRRMGFGAKQISPPALIGGVTVSEGAPEKTEEKARNSALQHNAAAIREFLRQGGDISRLPKTDLMPDMKRLLERNEVVPRKAS